MNVQALKRTSVTPTLCVTTQKGPTSVVALVDIRVMVEAAQVNFCFMRLFELERKLLSVKLMRVVV